MAIVLLYLLTTVAVALLVSVPLVIAHRKKLREADRVAEELLIAKKPEITAEVLRILSDGSPCHISLIRIFLVAAGFELTPKILGYLMVWLETQSLVMVEPNSDFFPAAKDRFYKLPDWKRPPKPVSGEAPFNVQPFEG